MHTAAYTAQQYKQSAEKQRIFSRRAVNSDFLMLKGVTKRPSTYGSPVTVAFSCNDNAMCRLVYEFF